MHIPVYLIVNLEEAQQVAVAKDEDGSDGVDRTRTALLHRSACVAKTRVRPGVGGDKFSPHPSESRPAAPSLSQRHVISFFLSLSSPHVIIRVVPTASVPLFLHHCDLSLHSCICFTLSAPVGAHFIIIFGRQRDTHCTRVIFYLHVAISAFADRTTPMQS